MEFVAEWQQKNCLAKKQQLTRKNWCSRMSRKPFSFWQNVVFTDETRIQLSSDGAVRVFRKKNEKFLPKNTRNMVSDKRSLMFWGAVRFDGRKMLVKCPNRMKSTDYLEILQKFDEKLNIPGLIFQQDNAPIHKSQIVGQFFEQRRWNVLEWPPYSPDLNIIENLWSVVKKRLEKQTINWENLETKVQEIWDSIDQELVENLYNSIPKRLDKVKKSRGAIIGY